MKSRLLLAAPVVYCIASVACSAEVGKTDSTGSVEQAAGSCSAVYGQCGGQGWTGATCCATGSVCTYSNPYYSQCLPGTGGGGSSSSSSQAATGVAATITATNNNTSPPSYNFSVTVTNNNAKTAQSNWQVAVNMPGVSAQEISGTYQNVNLNAGNALSFENVGGAFVFHPGIAGTALGTGQSTTFTGKATFSGSFTAPSVASVDGEASGSAGAGGNGIDEIARAAASAAQDIAIAYENNKPGNNGDPNYAYYDDIVLSSQMYTISNGQVVFDSTAPGYAFVPQQAAAILAFAQQDASVTSYLVSGLASCLHDTSGYSTWAFRAEALKGYSSKTYSGSMAGELPNASTQESGTITDNFTVTTKPYLGQIQVVISETSQNDPFFGVISMNDMHRFGWTTYAATSGPQSKYQTGNQVMCTPFNGPGGGTANPYFVLNVGGSTVGARQQIAPIDCVNGNGNCSTSAAIDAAAYNTPGDQFDLNGNLLGPQTNPFTLIGTQKYGDPTHQNNWATNSAANNGTFYQGLILNGNQEYKWLMCGSNGAGC